MHFVAQFTLFLAAAYAIAIAVWLTWNRRGLASWFGFGGSALILFTPLLISPPHVMLRALACVLAIELFFKTVDYGAQRRLGTMGDTRFPAYAAFLIPFPLFLVRFDQRSQRGHFNPSSWFATGAALIAFLLCFLLVKILSHVEMVRASFLVDHTAKFILFAIAIESLARCLYGLEQIAGYDTKPLIDNVFESRTVGEFWKRFNTRIHSWFDHHVFHRTGGMRHPVKPIFLTFLASGVLHEIGFGIATSRFDGYQFSFFMLQAPAVILSRHARRAATKSRLGKIALRGSTVLWMWATSVFFFHGVNRVFPFFYASNPWLP
jgi:hypothetical protein